MKTSRLQISIDRKSTMQLILPSSGLASEVLQTNAKFLVENSTLINEVIDDNSTVLGLNWGSIALKISMMFLTWAILVLFFLMGRGCCCFAPKEEEAVALIRSGRGHTLGHYLHQKYGAMAARTDDQTQKDSGGPMAGPSHRLN